MIVVTGATGFLGRHIIPLLIKENIGPIRCFVRETSDTTYLEKFSDIELKYGSFENKSSFVEALRGATSLINIASLGFGHGPDIVDACEEAGIKRAIFISTTAIFTQLNASTKSIRQEAEQKIKGSNLQYTILRPTMIYGTEKDRNMCRLVRVLNKTRLFPIFGTGEYKQQPIHVDDLAQAIIDCYKSSNSVNKEYNLSGKYPVTYNEVIDQTANALDKKVKKIHMPLSIVRPLIKIQEKILPNPILKDEQILRLNEHKDFEYKEAEADFNFQSRSFEEGITEEVERMRSSNII